MDANRIKLYSGQSRNCSEVNYSPHKPRYINCRTRNGLFRTTDAGTTWLLVDEKHCYDLALNTTNPDIMYASSDDILISEDAGATWSILENNLCGAGRSSIETTAANSNAIYCLCEWWGLYKSSDGGVSWDSKNYPSTTFYGYYDMALEVSDLDENLLFSGGLEVARSTNGGNTWQTKSSWDNWWTDEYVHADNHAFACHPLDNNIVYSIYPNPFSSDATIEFTLTQNSQIEIVLEEITGRTLKILLNDVINAGNHKTILNKYTLSAGMYVLRLSSEHDSISRKIIIE